MIPVVCFSALLFGVWPLVWDEKNERFKISTCYVFTSFFMFCNVCHHVYKSLRYMIEDDKVSTNPQYLILYTIYANVIILIVNRFVHATTRDGRRFADELMSACGRTVESGRCLPEYWLRATSSAAVIGLLHYKYRRFSHLPEAVIVARLTVPVGCCMFVTTTAECLYASACRALADELAALNRSAAALTRDRVTAARVAALSGTHGRLTRLARLFDDEYAVPVLLTTVNLLLRQIYALNDFVSVIIDSETYEPSYVNFICFNDALVWTVLWTRFWWVCYQVNGLVTQVHLTAKIMLSKDINSFPENTRQLAFDFLEQLLHRRVRISAWGFYDVNNELLFMVNLLTMANLFSITLFTVLVQRYRNSQAQTYKKIQI